MALGIGAGGGVEGGISSDVVLYVKNYTLGAHGVSDGTMSSVTFPKSCANMYLKSIKATVVETVAAKSWPSRGVVGYIGLGTTNYNINLSVMQINYPPSGTSLEITGNKMVVGSIMERTFTGSGTDIKISRDNGRNAIIGCLENTYPNNFVTVDLEVTLRSS